MYNLIMEELLTKINQLQENVLNELQSIDLDNNCKVLLKNILTGVDPYSSDSLWKTRAVHDYMYEQVHADKWKNEKIYLRQTVTITTYIQVVIKLKMATNLTDDLIKELFSIIDIGILFGCPLNKEPKLLQKCASYLSPFVSQFSLEGCQNVIDSELSIKTNFDNYVPINVIDCPSMETFYRDYILQSRPIILDNCMSHWPAVEKWKDSQYFIKLAGIRTIAVEVGKDYIDKDWTQKLMTMEEFVKSHIYRTEGPIGYLAQYPLFDHIPELKKDIIEPEYCSFGEKNKIDIMAWFGPKGTFSPLHYDGKRNLLAQVVGVKHMFLYPPKDTDNLYPHGEEVIYNSAQVDPRNPDLKKFPKYKEATPHYCILRPGQMLYIPPKWWHSIESLSVSFSVSFWWE